MNGLKRGIPVADVALRKESVDRNVLRSAYYSPSPSRSPQGERG